MRQQGPGHHSVAYEMHPSHLCWSGPEAPQSVCKISSMGALWRNGDPYMRLLLFSATVCAALVCAASARAVDYDAPLEIYSLPWVTHAAIGDVNGDGLPDIVTVHTTAASQSEYEDRVAISLQRPSGNFDLPLTHECKCRVETLDLVRDARAPGDDILISSFTDGYTEPDLHRPGFAVLDLLPDGTITSVRYREPFMYGESPIIVDINQDGHDDVFFSYLDDDNTTPINEFSYSLWYGDGGRGRLGERGATRGGFSRYQGPRFIYSGLLEPGDRQATPYGAQVDIDGDGYLDFLKGRCPSLCLYRQEPFRHLKMVGTTIDTSDGSPDKNTFGDLNGDGLTDRVITYSNSLSIFMQQPQLHFSEWNSLPDLILPGNAPIVDLDNNGLNDIAVVSMDGSVSSMGWLDVLLQQPGGYFQVQSLRIDGDSQEPRLLVQDLNRDGCRDLLMLRRMSGSLERHLTYLRGLNCAAASDLGVAVSGVGNTISVKAQHEQSVASAAGRMLRVTISPTTQDMSDSGLVVSPPSGCNAVAAVAPRRMFDCALPSLGPGNDWVLDFVLGFTDSMPPVEIEAVAFLLGAGDQVAENDRARFTAPFNAIVHGPKELH